MIFPHSDLLATRAKTMPLLLVMVIS